MSSSSPSSSSCSLSLPLGPLRSPLPSRLTFRGAFILLSIFQITFACLAVWYLGYSNTVQTVGSLTKQLRQEMLTRVHEEIEARLTNPMIVLDILYYGIDRHFPNFSQLDTITDHTGYLSELSFLASEFAFVDLFVVGNRRDVLMVAAKEANQTNSDPQYQMQKFAISDKSTNNTMLIYNVAAQWITGERSCAVAEYHTPTVPAFFSQIGCAGPCKCKSYPVFTPSDSVEETQMKLGVAVDREKNYSPRSRPWYVSAVDVKQAIVWSEAFPLTAGDIVNYTTSASRSYIDENGEVGFVVSTMIYLNFFNKVLSSLVFWGDNGYALLVEQRGLLIASSLQIETDVKGGVKVDSIQLDRVRAVIPYLLQAGVINSSKQNLTANLSSPSSYSSTASNLSSRTDPVLSLDVILFGEAAYIHANRLDIPGLPWYIIIVTFDKDWEGNQSQQNTFTALLSFSVLVGSVIITSIVTLSISSPLMRMVRFMQEVANVIQVEEGFQTEREKGTVNPLPSARSPPSPPSLLSPPSYVRNFNTLLQSWEESTTNTNSSAYRYPSNIYFLSTLIIPFSYLSSFVWTIAGHPLVGEVALMQNTFRDMLLRLRDSHQALERANQAKRHFLRYIFHEVRVPFNAIILSIDQLKNEAKHFHQNSRIERQVNDIIEILWQQSNVVSGILSDVLSLQKIEDGALQLVDQPFCFKHLVLTTCRSFQSELEKKDLSIRIIFPIVNERIAQITDEEWEAAAAAYEYYHAKISNTQMPFQERIDSPVATFYSLTFAKDESNHWEWHSGLLKNQQERKANSQDKLNLLREGIDLRKIGMDNSNEENDLKEESYTASGNNEVIQSVDTLTQDGLHHPFDSVAVFVRGDKYRMRQVLANFLSNAVKFSHVGGTITTLLTANLLPGNYSFPSNQKGGNNIATLPRSNSSVPLHPPSPAPSSDSSDNDSDAEKPHSLPPEEDSLSRRLGNRYIMLRVGVIDNGIGISPKEQASLFQPYAQVSQGENQEGRGTGLGLSICRSLIELHGGKVGVHSVEKKGSEFFFEVPMLVYVKHIRRRRKERQRSQRQRSSSSRAIPQPQQQQQLEPQQQMAKITNRQRILIGNHSSSTSLPISSYSQTETNGNVSLSQSSYTAISQSEETEELGEVSDAFSGRSVVPPSSSTPSSTTTPPSPPPPPLIGMLTNENLTPDLSKTSRSRSNTFSRSNTPHSDRRRKREQDTNNVIKNENAASNTQHPLHMIDQHRQEQVSLPLATSLKLSSPSSSSSPPPPPLSAFVGSSSVSSSFSSSSSSSSSFSSSSSTTAPIDNRLSPVILVVEDNAPSRKLLLMLLTSLGYNCQGAENGQICVDLFEKWLHDEKETKRRKTAEEQASPSSYACPLPADLILMDGQMPVMNGITATRHLRALSFNLPIVAVTGNALAEDQAEFLSAGADVVITKPIDKRKLLAVLKKYLDHNGFSGRNKKKEAERAELGLPRREEIGSSQLASPMEE